MSGHGSDGKRFWVITRNGGKVGGRNVAWSEIATFSAAPKLFGGASIMTALWIASCLFGDMGFKSFVALSWPPVILCVVLAIALWANDGGPVLRELAFGAGTLRALAFVASGLPWSEASRYEALALVLMLVPLAWYLSWGIRRAVWEPLVSALMFAGPLWLLALLPARSLLVAIMLGIFGLISAFFFGYALRAEYDERERAMMQID